ncbi:nucleoside recognition domain-containing protein [Halorientalis sp.]|uniref:nucleoside recognition domain-containing protein n=1 Tax=Halorientalis sp. TaxID=1931229 RepID=UPI002636E858|nr:nucleoside recognition domain-containing protein [Halorientalis sp.]
MSPTPTALLIEVLTRVASITVFIALGVGLASVAVEFGAVEYVAGFARPLTRPANLPPEVGTAILATTASPTAGYGMLAEYREAGLLDDRATLVAVTMNTFFGFAQHIFTFYAPVLIPILGLEVGLMYVSARALISLAITATGVAAGALLLSDSNVDTTVEADVDENAAVEADGGSARDRRRKLRAAGESTVEKIRDILPRLLAVYLVVATLVAYYDQIVAALFGSPDALGIAAAVAPVTGALGLPGAAIPTIAVFAVDTTNGAIFIAPLVENGTFTARAAVATMLVGGIVSFAVSTFKRSIPFQYGIWGREFGSTVIVVNTVLKILFIAVALVVLLAPSVV